MHSNDECEPRNSPRHCGSPSREDYISNLASPASSSGREDDEVLSRTYTRLESPRIFTKALPVTHEEIQLFNALISRCLAGADQKRVSARDIHEMLEDETGRDLSNYRVILVLSNLYFRIPR